MKLSHHDKTKNKKVLKFMWNALKLNGIILNVIREKEAKNERYFLK